MTSMYNQFIYMLIVSIYSAILAVGVTAEEECPKGNHPYALEKSCSCNGMKYNNECFCIPSWSGATCENKMCGGTFRGGNLIECNGHGECLNGKCNCEKNWNHPDHPLCDKQICPTSSESTDDCSGKGTCENGKCECINGFSGLDCSIPACPNNCTSTDNGVCTETSPSSNVFKCRCNGNRNITTQKMVEGWIGDDCSERKCRDDCNGHGDCVEGETNFTCKCHIGWTGLTCKQQKCTRSCNGHGTCRHSKCQCEEGFTGSSCEKPKCVDDCNGHGICQSENGKPNICACFKKWSGVTCNKKRCPRDCSGNGMCNSETGECSCNDEFWGDDCSKAECKVSKNLKERCSGNGKCVSGVCICNKEYKGTACEIKKCPNNCTSEKNGKCDDGVCKCNAGFTGEDCAFQMCSNDPSEEECGGKGDCVKGSCRCEQGWHGVKCQTRSCLDNCSGHGKCNQETGMCHCVLGWKNDNCSKPHVDHGHGVVSESGEVICFKQWTGLRCETRLCPLNCSGNGLCSEDGVCYCSPGYTGTACLIKSCPNACNYFGKCNNGICECNEGFKGNDCSLQYRLSGHTRKNSQTGEIECGLVEPKEASFKGQMWRGAICDKKTCLDDCNKGICQDDGTCLCPTSRTGKSCDIKVCPNQCSNNGICMSNGACLCNKGWSGNSCLVKRYCPYNCTSKSHGICQGKKDKNTNEIQSYKCYCKDGFTGDDCSQKSCKSGCVNGFCNNEGECVCNRDYDKRIYWSGIDCTEKRGLCPGKGNCNEQGDCKINGKCSCYPGWSGEQCEKAKCVKDCHSHGVCENQECYCAHGYFGKYCGKTLCPNMCSKHGHCQSNGKCKCDKEWNLKDDCSEHVCENKCSGHGVCNISSSACVCNEGWIGDDCSKNCKKGCEKKCSKVLDSRLDSCLKKCFRRLKCAQHSDMARFRSTRKKIKPFALL